MHLTGRCYCGDIHYEVDGDPILKVQCHCRECQYLSGGGPNYTIGMPDEKFKFTKGSPKQFTRSDIANAVTREFCPRCGTQLITRASGLPNVVLIKVGTLDNPAVFEQPEIAIFTVDKQGFHHIPEHVQSFEGLPG